MLLVDVSNFFQHAEDKRKRGGSGKIWLGLAFEFRQLIDKK